VVFDVTERSLRRATFLFGGADWLRRSSRSKRRVRGRRSGPAQYLPTPRSARRHRRDRSRRRRRTRDQAARRPSPKVERSDRERRLRHRRAQRDDSVGHHARGQATRRVSGAHHADASTARFSITRGPHRVGPSVRTDRWHSGSPVSALWSRVSRHFELSAATLASRDYVAGGLSQRSLFHDGPQPRQHDSHVTLEPTDWYSPRFTCTRSRGFAQGTAFMWSESGTLLATASQSIAARAWDMSAL